ncbi:rod shape-determining protein RodA [Congregibacter variabilis]|uniref:Peptidoglycan glycosyltransferase MrdB n=1 Tax=Congregibacter variabilis TaxID=3081200 RepID=A0ABZ0HYR6_9GAMM|nr:rod shape-determining protein RodA [Congregibacter sp. IMCC43200]
MSEYVRQMPDNVGPLTRPPGLARKMHVDAPLLVLLLALTAYGLLVLYSASGQSMDAVARQGRYFVLAYVVMFVMAQFSPVRWSRWSPWGYLLGVALLAAVAVAGVGAKGAQRWLDLGGFRFQPSEVMKLAVPMTIAWYLGARVLPPASKHIVVCLLLIVIPCGLIIRQPDLGTSLLIGASGLFGIFMAGISWRFIFGTFLVAIFSAWPAWMFMLEDYQKQRILTLLNPESDKLGAGWNIIQSKTAIGSGGWSGKGWTQGTQSQLDFLPESHTDFIIAVLAEEFGLQGVLLLIGLYILILLRAFWIGLNAQSSYGRILCGSITLTFFVYIFVNMGMVAGLLPVVGVPLPLVSAGGTSVVTLMAGFGLLMAVSTEKRVVGQ